MAQTKEQPIALLKETLVLDGGLRREIYDVVTLQPTFG